MLAVSRAISAAYREATPQEGAEQPEMVRPTTALMPLPANSVLLVERFERIRLTEKGPHAGAML